jgi:hypothetical protein
MNTVDKILESTGLDFEIIKFPFVDANDPELETGYYGLKNGKTGETLNSVKAGYTVSQNRDLVSAVLEGIKDFNGKLRVTKGGMIHGGRRVYLQVEIEGESAVGDDIVKRNITIIDSNDGTSGLSVGVGTLTMSCQNQFYQFYKAGMLKVRHTLTIEQKIKELPKLIEVALRHSIKLVKKFQDWEQTPVIEEVKHQLVQHLLGVDRTMSEDDLKAVAQKRISSMNSLYKHLENEMTTKGETLWGLHSGVTSWTTHEKRHPKRINGHLESLASGSNYKVANQAMEFIDAL